MTKRTHIHSKNRIFLCVLVWVLATVPCYSVDLLALNKNKAPTSKSKNPYGSSKKTAPTKTKMNYTKAGALPKSNVAAVPINGYSWVINNSLSGMPKPGATDPTEGNLLFLQESGIDLLVSLTETPIDISKAAQHGISVLHIPVKDFTAPTLEQLALFVSEAEEAIQSGDQVGVHCLGGKGRTGTFLAAYFIFTGMQPHQAINYVRELRPGSIETIEQEEILTDYYYFLQDQ